MISVIVPEVTPRIEYTLEFISTYTGIRFKASTFPLPGNHYTICYDGQPYGIAFHMYPDGLLSKTGIELICPEVKTDEQSGLPYFFASNHGDFQFDIFAFTFYLLSRYEEYSSEAPRDKHNRFPAKASLAFRHSFLDIPLIDQWLDLFMQRLSTYFGHDFLNERARIPSPEIVLTYDIDFPWAFKHRSLASNLAGIVKDLFHGEWIHLRQRFGYLFGIYPDPYDNYGQMLNTQYEHLQQIVFFLMRGGGDFDRNHHVNHPAFKALVRRLQSSFKAGIHISYKATEKGYPQILKEKMALEELLKKAVHKNRAHFLRIKLTETYQSLLEAGITEDYTMGYSHLSGFRSGTAQTHYWFDLSKNKSTKLSITPLIFMDTTYIHHYDNVPTNKTQEILEGLIKQVELHHGRCCILWHNNHLSGQDPRYKEWFNLYKWSATRISTLSRST